MDAQLLEKIKSVAQEVFGPRDVLAAYAYGSRVRGRAVAHSDLDVGYYLLGYWTGRTLQLREEMALAVDLSARLDLEVDLRDLAEAPLELRGRVLEEGVRIFSSNDAERVALERYLLARYHDYKDLFRSMHELRLRRIAQEGL